MYDDQVRTAVALYLTGGLTEEEAVQRADIPRSELRHYARTCGAVVPAPTSTVDETNSETGLIGQSR